MKCFRKRFTRILALQDLAGIKASDRDTISRGSWSLRGHCIIFTALFLNLTLKLAIGAPRQDPLVDEPSLLLREPTSCANFKDDGWYNPDGLGESSLDVEAKAKKVKIQISPDAYNSRAKDYTKTAVRRSIAAQVSTTASTPSINTALAPTIIAITNACKIKRTCGDSEKTCEVAEQGKISGPSYAGNTDTAEEEKKEAAHLKDKVRDVKFESDTTDDKYYASAKVYMTISEGACKCP